MSLIVYLIALFVVGLFVGALAAILIEPIAAMLLQLAVSRQRVYLADATAAKLLG